MKTFVLGAGLSYSAGYPLSSELLCEIEMKQLRSPVAGEKEDWEEVQEWISENRDSIPGFQTDNPQQNLEYLLTYLDLCLMASDDRDDWILREIISEDTAPPQRSSLYEQFAQNSDDANPVKKIRKTIQRSLISFFNGKNRQDCGKENDFQRRFIHTFCANMLEPGDVTISFNYDSLVERSLIELNKWNPSDGYGFEVEFRKGIPPSDAPTAPQAKSEVTVLKLHGSVGWYLNNNQVFIDHRFLESLGVTGIEDCNEPKTVPYGDSPPSLIEPSFIKTIDKAPAYRQVWRRAREALEKADVIYIIGYSLPDADILARNLLAETIGNGENKNINIINPSRGRKRTFEALLGNCIVYTEISFEDWIEQMYA
jgi:hypothetical protein